MTTTAGSSRHLVPAVLGLVLFAVGAALALSVDVPRNGYGVKADEATYVAAALSVAYDGDLAFERRDLERFAGLYHAGPDGIFLKRGKVLRIRAGGPFPFLHILKRDDPNRSRLYFGKSIAYPLLAAPFARLFGLNGLLLFNVVLLGVAAGAAYAFLATQSPPASAALITTAFLGASVLPAYAAFLLPEIFNFTLVLLAYVLWLYKEVSPGSPLDRRWTDVAAAALLGLCTYSKPLPIAVLVAPIVLLAWTRRRWMRGFVLGAVAVGVAAAFFTFNAAVSGEFNYQGGDRKAFYGRFPFDRPDFAWEERGGTVLTDGGMAQLVLTSPEAPMWFARNVQYFLLGRHFGFVPYFFPGVVAIGWWMGSSARRDTWRRLVFLTFVGSAAALLLVTPFTWSGGGGPPGNRYVFAAYPVLLFLIPPGISFAPGVLAWIGGAIFTAKILTSPFVAAKFTWQLAEKGPVRRLPVELTMANDLPVMLAQPLRGRVQYRTDPGVLLYFLDQNAWPPEPNGIWISGGGQTQVIVRTPWPIDRIEVEAESPIHTTLRISLGSDPVSVTIEPGKVHTFAVKASGVRGFGDYDYLLEARSSEGFVPHLLEPANMDYRNLGAQVRFLPVIASAGAASPK